MTLLVRGGVVVARGAAVLLLAALVVVLLLSIAVRELGVFGGAIVWAEEAERFLFIWLIFLGSPVAFDRGEHILIDTLVRLFAPRAALVVALVTRLLVLGFLGVMLSAGIDLVGRTGNQTAVALGIPMSLVHAALPLGAALMTAQVALLLARDARALVRGESRPVSWKTGGLA